MSSLWGQVVANSFPGIDYFFNSRPGFQIPKYSTKKIIFKNKLSHNNSQKTNFMILQSIVLFHIHFRKVLFQLFLIFAMFCLLLCLWSIRITKWSKNSYVIVKEAPHGQENEPWTNPAQPGWVVHIRDISRCSSRTGEIPAAAAKISLSRDQTGCMHINTYTT